MPLAPIALFAFNRPEHLSRTLEYLEKNKLADLSSLYIFSDGPRSSADIERVEEVRKIISNATGFARITTIYQNKNLGLADSISAGVTQLTETYGKCIVIEDDIITSPFFLEYMNTALTLYENDERVMHISGFIPKINPSDLPDTFFLRQSSCWGWATWKRAWNNFSRDGKKFIDSFSKDEILEFNLHGNYDYWSQLILNENGNLKTWAVFWYATVFSLKGLCLHPRHSLVSNIGFDGSGENCGISNEFNIHLSNQEITYFPQGVEVYEHKLATERFIQYFSKSKKSRLTVFNFKKWLRKFVE